MKKMMFALLLGVFAVFAGTPVFAAEMSKAQAAAYLQKVLKDKVAEAGKERLQSELTKIAPGAMGLYKKITGIIANEELAASLCWDLINLGLQNNREKFAAQFAIRMRKYIPKEYSTGADEINSLTSQWGFHITTEADCVTVLYELGKNTFDAISKMSESEKQEVRSAGDIATNLTAVLLSLGGTTARQTRKMFERQDPPGK